jgi:uncharacterized membrane protein
MDRSTPLARTRPGLFSRLADNLSIGTDRAAATSFGTGHVLFAAVMIGLGIRGLVYGDFASVWQHVNIEHPTARQVLAHACALVALAGGVGLLFRRTVGLSAFVLLVYLLLWVVLLKLHGVVSAPRVMATWLGFGEIILIMAGAWILFATHAPQWARRHFLFAIGAAGVRWARLLVVLSLPMIGLAHFVYAKETAAFVPAWIPGPYFWAYLTGAASIAASLGMLFAIWPRLAATLEAAMLSVITLLVWLPVLIATPGNDSWTPLLMSTAIACGAWVVADSYRGESWFGPVERSLLR